MAEQVLMPQLGESVTEGTIGQWLKHPGDHVDKYESLLEVLTDKVNAEVPAPVAGTVVKLLVEEGATVPIGTPICELDTGSGESAAPAPAAEPSAAEVAPAAPPSAASAAVSAAAKAAPAREGTRYSPAVRRLAAEHQVDPAAVTGTGAGGRVTRGDVLKFAEAGAKAPAAAPARGAEASAPAPAAMAAGAPAHIEDGDTLEPVSQVRRVIAERMVRSKQTVPHAWLMVEADVTGLVALRARHKDVFRERHGVPLTYLPFMMRAVVRALQAVPIMNAQWSGDQIVMKRRVNVGIAAATARGLVVPVVHDADEKNVVGLAKATQDLTQRARSGRLKLEDLSGGTFTVDNTGAVGTVLTYPIINAPEVGIVTMESIVKRPRVMPGDAIAVRSMVNLCLSFDHRVVDGAEAALFVNTVKTELEALTRESPID